MHDHGQQQPQGVDHDVALAPLDLLAGVVAPGPATSVVWTDWLSRMAALGVAARPARCRTRDRRVSWMRSQSPSRRHRRK